MDQKHEIGLSEKFLESFVKALIFHSKNQNNNSQFELSGNPIDTKLKEEPKIELNTKPREKEKDLPDIKPKNPELILKPSFQQKISQDPTPPRKAPTEIPLIPPTLGNPDIGRLNFLIADRGISSIQCAGPGKNLTVRKGSQILTTSLILNESEINDVINKFSTITKIPMINGFMKAINNNLMFSANSGQNQSSFTIQKINPSRYY